MSELTPSIQLGRTRDPVARPWVWLRVGSVPVRAFIASRLLVLVAGVAGTSWIRPYPWSGSVIQTHVAGLPGVLAATTDRWDAGWYLSIAQHGYARGAAAVPRLGFLPGYPLLIRALAVLTRSPVAAGILVSLGCLMVALVLLHRLTELELSRRAADATVLLLCFAPTSLFLSAIYSESLCLALSVGSLYALRTDRWRLACALGAAAALTRVNAVAIVFALVVGRLRRERRLEPGLGWAALVPAALLAYMGVLALRGLPPLGLLDAQSAAHAHRLVGPVAGVAEQLAASAGAVWHLLHGAPIYAWDLGGVVSLPAENVWLAVVLGLCLACAVACRHRLAPEYFAYAAGALIIVTSSPVPATPLISLDRYALTIVPLWMAAGAWLADRTVARRVVSVVAAAGLAWCSAVITGNAWVA